MAKWRAFTALASMCVVASVAGGGRAIASTGATPSKYTFTPIAYLGNAAPGGGSFIVDFEPSAVNDSGEVAFTADLSQDGVNDIGEGTFVGTPGHLVNLARVGQPAPRGGTFSIGELGRMALNNRGDVSFAFTLDPFTFPLGLNAGVYRQSQDSSTLSALMAPGDPAPGGGTFAGTWFHTGINATGATVFSGIVSANSAQPPSYNGMAEGLFLATPGGAVVKVVRPGDPAPGGQTFDDANNGSINDAGDIAFGAHIAGDPCVDIGSPLLCGESVYRHSATSGTTVSIAHQGSPSPCAATPYRQAFGPLINNDGNIAFIGDLTPPSQPPNTTDAVFQYTNGRVRVVACPGMSMPGGGHMVSAGAQDGTYSLNAAGRITYAAVLDTSTGGVADNGVYLLSNGHTSVVARTGTVMRGVGTIASLGLTSPGSAAAPLVQDGGLVNDKGQVLFSATLTDGRVALVLATPTT